MAETAEERNCRREEAKARLKNAISSANKKKLKKALLESVSFMYDSDSEMYELVQHGKQVMKEIQKAEEAKKDEVAHAEMQLEKDQELEEDEFSLTLLRQHTRKLVTEMESTLTELTDEATESLERMTELVDLPDSADNKFASEKLAAKEKQLTGNRVETNRRLKTTAAGFWPLSQDTHIATTAPTLGAQKRGLSPVDKQEDKEISKQNDEDAEMENTREKQEEETRKEERRKWHEERMQQITRQQEAEEIKKQEERRKRAEETAKIQKDLRMVMDWHPGTSSTAPSSYPCCAFWKSWFSCTSEKQPLSEMSGDHFFRQWSSMRNRSTGSAEATQNRETLAPIGPHVDVPIEFHSIEKEAHVDSRHSTKKVPPVKPYDQKKRNCGCGAKALDDCLFPNATSSLTLSEATAIRR